MCRWMGWLGQPLLVDELLFKSEHGIVEQSAHVRAAIGSPVQQTNCHPFRHGRWLFVHNGYLGGFATIRRELMLAVAPDRFTDIGSRPTRWS